MDKTTHPPSGPGQKLRDLLAPLFRSWYGLTPAEQRVALTILSLFLLGLATRFWHVRHHASTPGKPLPAAAATD